MSANTHFQLVNRLSSKDRKTKRIKNMSKLSRKIALIAGAAVMALSNNEFKWKSPSKELAMWAIIGGFFMGVGSRLGLGCNVGGFFVRAANGDISGWIYGMGMMVGAYIGVVFFNWYTEKKMAKEMAAFD
jgi:uncharacterized membrane protein YedE/YeeE